MIFRTKEEKICQYANRNSNNTDTYSGHHLCNRNLIPSLFQCQHQHKDTGKSNRPCHHKIRTGDQDPCDKQHPDYGFKNSTISFSPVPIQHCTIQWKKQPAHQRKTYNEAADSNPSYCTVNLKGKKMSHQNHKQQITACQKPCVLPDPAVIHITHQDHNRKCHRKPEYLPNSCDISITFILFQKESCKHST